ncbi:MAG: ATP-binding protein [Candidatus Kapaibacterium sp.]
MINGLDLLSDTSDSFLINNLNIGVYLTKESGDILFANKALYEMLGYTGFQELKQRNLAREGFEPSYPREKFIKLIKSQKEVRGLESFWKKKDDTKLFIRENAKFIKEGKSNYFLGTVEDISDKWHSHEILKNSELFYRAISDNSFEAIAIFNNNYDIEYVNPAFCSLTHRSKGEIIGKNLNYFSPSEKVAAYWRELLLQAQNTGELTGGIWSYFDTYNARDKHVEFNVKYVDIVNINHGYLIVFLHDISERIESLNKLKESNYQKDKFFSIIAHDLKTPIAGFMGLTETLIQEFSELTVAEVLEISSALNQSAFNLYKLLENLLEWSNIARHDNKPNYVVFSLFELSEQAIDLFRQQALNKGITIINEIDSGLFVKADKNMIFTVMRNFISNAVKFSSKNSSIRLYARIDGDKVSVSIQDQGIGITKDKLAEIFSLVKSYKSKGTNNEPGSGIGLILCKELLLKHGSTIGYKSKEGEGSTFTFGLKKAN